MEGKRKAPIPQERDPVRVLRREQAAEYRDERFRLRNEIVSHND